MRSSLVKRRTAHRGPVAPPPQRRDRGHGGPFEALYEEADPKGIVVSTPGVGVTLSAGILGRLGDPNRFANLAGVRSFTGIVPKIDQSGPANRHKGLTKAEIPGYGKRCSWPPTLPERSTPPWPSATTASW